MRQCDLDKMIERHNEATHKPPRAVNDGDNFTYLRSSSEGVNVDSGAWMLATVDAYNSNRMYRHFSVPPATAKLVVMCLDDNNKAFQAEVLVRDER